MVGRRLPRYVFLSVLTITLFLLLRGHNPFGDPRPSAKYAALRRKITFVPSSFDWTTVQQFFPVSSHTPLPNGTPRRLPKVQHPFPPKNKRSATTSSSAAAAKVNDRRRSAVRRVFQRSWTAYKRDAWLWDELQPVTGGGRNTFGGWAATLVDALDTLWLMELYPDFYAAAAAAAALDFANTTETAANLFETTIRHLGGLLAAHDLSHEPALLAKARELGDMLYAAFDTPNRLPGFWLDFDAARAGHQLAGTHDPSASPASLSLEFTRLAQLTGDAKYYDAIDRVRAFLARTQRATKLPGMWPIALDFRAEEVGRDSDFTLGALADSLYEYLPKMFILTGGLEPSYENMYRDAMDVAVEHILFRPMLPGNEDILFAGNAHVSEDRVDHIAEGQHLSCFVGGMFLLGGRTFGIEEHVAIGERAARGCAWAYDAFPTGLMPEIFTMFACPTLDGCEWDAGLWKSEGNQLLKEGFKTARDPRYILRPEAIESLFLLYRVTGNEQLRDIAWRMFESVMKSTETSLANSAIADVTVTGPTTKLDSMEVSQAVCGNHFCAFFCLTSTVTPLPPPRRAFGWQRP
ncbi:unnamed protein product [Discula destructiva]